MKFLKVTWDFSKLKKLWIERKGEVYIVVDIRQGKDRQEWISNIYDGVGEGESFSPNGERHAFNLYEHEPFVVTVFMMESDKVKHKSVIKSVRKQIKRAVKSALSALAYGDPAAKVGEAAAKAIIKKIRKSDVLGYHSSSMTLDQVESAGEIVLRVSKSTKNCKIAKNAGTAKVTLSVMD